MVYTVLTVRCLHLYPDIYYRKPLFLNVNTFFFFSMAWFPHWQDWFTGVSQSLLLLIKATFQQSESATICWLFLCWLPTLHVTSSSSPLFHFLWFCASFGSFQSFSPPLTSSQWSITTLSSDVFSLKKKNLNVRSGTHPLHLQLSAEKKPSKL